MYSYSHSSTLKTTQVEDMIRALGLLTLLSALCCSLADNVSTACIIDTISFFFFFCMLHLNNCKSFQSEALHLIWFIIHLSQH